MSGSRDLRDGLGTFRQMTTFLATWEQPGKVAIENAWDARKTGADLRTCLEKGLTACEEDTSLLAIGRGSLPNSEGDLELDASMMDGSDLSAGAVCSLRGISPAISVARMVLERTPHVMLAGDQAQKFAVKQGFEIQNLMTQDSLKLYQEWRKGRFDDRYIHTVDDGEQGLHENTDTVTMIGLESPAHLVAASSTSGLSWKLPGRVGDSPIIGAGIYADDEAGAAGATGWGEELWKACASFRAVEHIRNGKSPQQACELVVQQMLRRQPLSHQIPCVVFAMDREGNYGAATTKETFHLWICRDGEMKVRAYHGLQP